MRWLGRLIALLLILAIAVPLTFRVLAAFRESEVAGSAIPTEGAMIPTRVGDIYVEEQGDPNAPPVIFVHGSVGWAGLWREAMTAVAAEGHRAIAFDMPPMGYSARFDSDNYARPEQGSRLLALVDALDIKPIIVAHSFGAGAAVEAVMAEPDAFRGLIIVDGALGVGKTGAGGLPGAIVSQGWLAEIAVASTITNPLMTKRLLRAFMAKKDMASDTYVDLIQQPLNLDGTTESIARWLPTLIATPAGTRSSDPEEYRRASLPTAIIWGEADTTTPIEQGRELAELIPNARLLVLPDLGHIPQIEDPVAFQKALTEALQGMEIRN